jgi:hypothetical protein
LPSSSSRRNRPPIQSSSPVTQRSLGSWPRCSSTWAKRSITRAAPTWVRDADVSLPSIRYLKLKAIICLNNYSNLALFANSKIIFRVFRIYTHGDRVHVRGSQQAFVTVPPHLQTDGTPLPLHAATQCVGFANEDMWYKERALGLNSMHIAGMELLS